MEKEVTCRVGGGGEGGHVKVGGGGEEGHVQGRRRWRGSLRVGWKEVEREVRCRVGGV